MKKIQQVLLLCLCVVMGLGEDSAGEDEECSLGEWNWSVTKTSTKENHSVPLPRNLVVKSYNFRTFLYWDWDVQDSENTSNMPHFSVAVREYKKGRCITVPNCTRIIHRYCDITKQFQDVGNSYWAAVKAIVGPQESESTITSHFFFHDQGVIGPPRINIASDGRNIRVAIEHPLTPFKEKYTVRMIYTDFKYQLFSSWNNLSQARTVENCTIHHCTGVILAPTPPVNYCVSAEGKSEHWVVKGERSNETCIYIPHLEEKLGLWYVGVIAVVISIVVAAAIIGTFILLHSLAQKKTIRLPKSLANIVRNFHPYPGNEESTQSQVLVVPAFERIGPSTENDKLTCEEGQQQSHHLSETEEDTEDNNLLKGSLKSDEANNMAEKSDDVDKAYAVESVAELTESSNSSSVMYKEETSSSSHPQVPSIIRPAMCNMSSGYDRPHVLDILVDVNDEDCVVGYRSIRGDVDQDF